MIQVKELSVAQIDCGILEGGETILYMPRDHYAWYTGVAEILNMGGDNETCILFRTPDAKQIKFDDIRKMYLIENPVGIPESWDTKDEMSSSKETPVDRSAICLTDGSPIVEGYNELKSNGQQKGYIVLTEEERTKGFVRPLRCSYVHLTCGTSTKMSMPLAETYARDPKFYNGTFCVTCKAHFPLNQFVWEGTEEQVGN